MSGKLKMVLQCLAAAMALVYLARAGHHADWISALRWLMVASIWAAVALTVYSGVVYVRAAVRLLSQP
jgi:CDP-diacylglycerol--glycerol-3-phosphate 3-phosphatidyltransferase